MLLPRPWLSCAVYTEQEHLNTSCDFVWSPQSYCRLELVQLPWKLNKKLPDQWYRTGSEILTKRNDKWAELLSIIIFHSTLTSFPFLSYSSSQKNKLRSSGSTSWMYLILLEYSCLSSVLKYYWMNKFPPNICRMMQKIRTVQSTVE